MHLVRQGKVFLYGEPVGMLSQDKQGFHFRYFDDYQGPSLSLSLPTTQRVFHAEFLFPYFSSLVPEGWLKEKYARFQKIDEQDLFGLLLNNGEDLLGAVQILRNL